MPDNEHPELSVTIRVPEGASEVLVRVPHLVSRVCPEDVQVDFRPAGGVWTPSAFFAGSVRAEVQ